MDNILFLFKREWNALENVERDESTGGRHKTTKQRSKNLRSTTRLNKQNLRALHT